MKFKLIDSNYAEYKRGLFYQKYKLRSIKYQRYVVNCKHIKPEVEQYNKVSTYVDVPWKYAIITNAGKSYG